MADERSTAARLAELQQLHDDGLITDDELSEGRTALIKELSTPPPGPHTTAPTPNSGTPGKWTPEEQAAYRATHPKKGIGAQFHIDLTETQKKFMIIAIVIVAAIVALMSINSMNEREDRFRRSTEDYERSKTQISICIDRYPTNAVAREVCLSR